MEIKRYEVTDKQKLWLTKKSASEILGVKLTAIEFVKPSDNSMVCVGMFNGCKHIHEDEFKYLYRQSRCERAVNLPITKLNRSEYIVNNHKVCLTNSRQVCDCEDFAIQKKVMGHGECKHIIATLNTQGYASLAQYLFG